MRTYSFDDRGMDSLYEHLYKQIKSDIVNGSLEKNEKLPSKRALASHLNVSVVTVENAYAQLLAEGYIYSKPKSGYYVCDLSSEQPAINKNGEEIRNAKTEYTFHVNDTHQTLLEDYEEKNVGAPYFADFVGNYTISENFPFSTWTKLVRETLMDSREKLMTRSHFGGAFELRKAIADHLYQFRGMTVSPNQIIVGAGTEYLYGLIIQLLGREGIYGVENPGYSKIQRIYEANGVRCCHIDMDENGINIEALEKSGAEVVHISPSHHFPTGTVTSASRRYELLAWAAKSENRYIIEDEYDSELRLVGKPIPALQSIDASDKVIYMNTFSKSLSSTIRISYMVLPMSLMVKYSKELGFYSCTVSNFEQYTLARFISEGYLEKHINRMRNYYRNYRDRILNCIRAHENFDRLSIYEENSGLHFLLSVDTAYSDKEMVERAARKGINISCVSQYYHGDSAKDSHMLVINYSGIHEDRVDEAIDRLLKSVISEQQ